MIDTVGRGWCAPTASCTGRAPRSSGIRRHPRCPSGCCAWPGEPLAARPVPHRYSAAEERRHCADSARGETLQHELRRLQNRAEPLTRGGPSRASQCSPCRPGGGRQLDTAHEASVSQGAAQVAGHRRTISMKLPWCSESTSSCSRCGCTPGPSRILKSCARSRTSPRQAVAAGGLLHRGRSRCENATVSGALT